MSIAPDFIHIGKFDFFIQVIVVNFEEEKYILFNFKKFEVIMSEERFSRRLAIESKVSSSFLTLLIFLEFPFPKRGPF